MMILEEIRAELEGNKEETYAAFQRRLLPNLPKERIVGVRTPVLRQYARQLARREDVGEFLNAVPHDLFEEDQLHSFILSQEKDFARSVSGVEKFLPYVDNWATCDQMKPKAFEREKEQLLPWIDRWLASDHEYTVRFGVEMLMNLFLDDDFEPEYLEKVAAVRHEAYYVRMMAAWYFATALAKQYDAALPILLRGKLETWTHNKTIQKALESDRITPEQKTFLRGLKK